MGKIVYNHFGFLIFVLSAILISAYCFIPNKQPQPTPTLPKIRAVQVGYDLDKVGKDSILVVKGQFVKQLGDRVVIKIN
jgi:hypothetical protein